MKKSGRAIVALAALSIAGGCAMAATTPHQPIAASSPAGPDTPERYVDVADLAAIIKPYLSSEGFMDPDFPATVATPSPYYTDFFGTQAIADVSRDAIIEDFVPRYAAQIGSDAHSITLRFKAGYDAVFHPRSSFEVKGIVVPVAHVRIGGGDWRAIQGNVRAFIDTVKSAGLADKYLLPNPFYDSEKATAAQLRSGAAAPITVDPDLSLFDSKPDAVLLVPEGVHGRSEAADQLMTILAAHDADWLGMEMLSVEQQEILDAYNKAREGTAAYQAARAGLIDYFADAWNGRAGPKTTGEENYYFKLVEAAHHRGTRVIALEAASMPFLLFRYGETQFGGSVRSGLWANRLPQDGRGVIFGGSAHFNSPGSANVQDFLAARDQGRTIVSLEDLKVETGAQSGE